MRDRAVAVQERRRRPRRAARVLRSDNGCCVWTGVMCGEAKAAVAIVGLALPNRTLRGQVVVSLPSLAALRVLNLSGNAIRGALPARSTSSLRSRGGSATASSSAPCCCPSASSASSRPDTAPPPSVRCVRAFVRHLSSLPFPSCVWRWWGLRLTLLWCGSCRQGRGPAPGADELQHPDGAGGVVAGQDARRSVCSAPRIKSSSRESNLSEIQPPHCLR